MICSKCGLDKPKTTEFFGLDRGRFMRRCRLCHALAQSRQREREGDKVRARERANRQKNKAKVSARDSARAKRERGKRRALQKRWREANPERTRQKGVEYAARRRALKKSAGGSFTADDFAAILKAQKGKCWWCRNKISGTPEADHRIPLARGGSNGPENIVAACGPCNRAKSALMPWEFAGTLV